MLINVQFFSVPERITTVFCSELISLFWMFRNVCGSLCSAVRATMGEHSSFAIPNGRWKWASVHKRNNRRRTFRKPKIEMNQKFLHAIYAYTHTYIHARTYGHIKSISTNLRISCETVTQKAFIMWGNSIYRYIKRFIEEFIICHLVTNRDLLLICFGVSQPAVSGNNNNSITYLEKQNIYT